MKSLNPSILYERIEKLEKINNDLNKRVSFFCKVLFFFKIIAREQQTLKWIERCIFSIVIVFLLLVCLFNGRVHDICVYIANYYWTVIAGTLTLFKNIFKDMFIKTFANISKIVSM